MRKMTHLEAKSLLNASISVAKRAEEISSCVQEDKPEWMHETALTAMVVELGMLLSLHKKTLAEVRSNLGQLA
jgi:hypothetical protein